MRAAWRRRCARFPSSSTSPSGSGESNPDAWIIDFTNPVGIVTRALLSEGHQAVGLCNVAIGFQRRFAGMLGVTPEQVELDHVGLNHLTWERGGDGGRRERAAEAARLARRPSSPRSSKLPAELLLQLGVVPSYYLRYFYAHDEVVRELLEKPSRAAEVAAIEKRAARPVRRPVARREARAAGAARWCVLLRGRGRPGVVAARRHRRRPGRQHPQQRHPAVPPRRRGDRGTGDGRSSRYDAAADLARSSRCTPDWSPT